MIVCMLKMSRLSYNCPFSITILITDSVQGDSLSVRTYLDSILERMLYLFLQHPFSVTLTL